MCEIEARLLRHYMQAGTLARDLLGWVPDPKQMSVLQSMARTVILNCSRQWGKSTLAAVKALHVALMQPEMTAMIVSENLSQTAEFMNKVDRFLARLGQTARGEAGKAVSRRLANGSRIVGIAAREAAVRGYTADFVFLDEAARIEDDVIDAVAPVLAVRRGDLWMASTPNGMRGRFWEMWTSEDAGEDVLKVCVPWTENARIDGAYVEKLRRAKGADFVAQEFECQFVEAGDCLVSTEDFDANCIGRKL